MIHTHGSKPYSTKLWDDYFPVMAENPTMECPKNPLWSSAYLLARSPLDKLVEFVLYQNEAAYNTYQDWSTESDFKDECFWIKAPQLIYTPLIGYGVYAFSNTIMWGINAVTSYITLVLPDNIYNIPWKVKMNTNDFLLPSFFISIMSFQGLGSFIIL